MNSLNEELARLRGWTLKENWDYFSWFNRDGKYICDSVDLPDIVGNNCEAITAAEWMKEQGWNYTVGFHDTPDWLYWASFWKGMENTFRSDKQPSLSLAIAKAMREALKEKK